MLIHANTKSRGWKRGADKAIAKKLKRPCCLTEMVGSLHLDAHNPADLSLLTAMYKHVFSPRDSEGRGSIIVKDSKGKRVLSYFYAPVVGGLSVSQ